MRLEGGTYCENLVPSCFFRCSSLIWLVETSLFEDRFALNDRLVVFHNIDSLSNLTENLNF